MDKLLKTTIIEMHEDISLSTDDLNKLYGIEKQILKYENVDITAKKTDSRIKEYFFYKPLLGYIAAFSSILFIGGITWLLLTSSPLGQQKIDNILSDVIQNHRSHDALAYKTSSLSEIKNNFSHLSFTLFDPTKTTAASGDLIGARPCLILNRAAVELRYKNNNALWTTVYQTRYEKRLHGPIPNIGKGEPPLLDVSHNTKISLWQQNGVLFAVAAAP